jgi:hypothetical protein
VLLLNAFVVVVSLSTQSGNFSIRPRNIRIDLSEKRLEMYGLDSSGTGQRLDTAHCEHDNET